MIARVKQTLYNEIHQINRFPKLLLHIILSFCFNDRYGSAAKETRGSLSPVFTKRSGLACKFKNAGDFEKK